MLYEELNILIKKIQEVKVKSQNKELKISDDIYYKEMCDVLSNSFDNRGIMIKVVMGYRIEEIGNSREYIIDSKRIEGTILDMLEGAIVFCKRNMKVKTIIDSKTGKRNDKTEYPINAVREAILNALIYRDYSIYTEGTPIQINFFIDRLEIRSPNGISEEMEVEQLKKVRQDLKDIILEDIKIEMKEYGLPEPEFKNDRNEFIVILYNKEAEKK